MRSGSKPILAVWPRATNMGSWGPGTPNNRDRAHLGVGGGSLYLVVVKELKLNHHNEFI